MTPVCDIGDGAQWMLAVTEAGLRSCLEGLGETACRPVQFVRSDMWKPHLNVIARRHGGTVHVLDRFHVM